MPVLEHFDLLAPFYERAMRRAPLAGELIRLLNPGEGDLILDAAGGTGRVAQTLLRRAGRVVVADLSFPMLREARKKPGLLPTRSQAEGLPFQEGTFDRILMVDALHHVFDQGGTVRELMRVLKRGGRIVIEEPDIASFWVKLVALGEKVALMRSHFLGREAVEALFAPYACKVETTQSQSTLWVLAEK